MKNAKTYFFRLGNDILQVTATPEREDFEIVRDWLALCLRQIEKSIKESEPETSPATTLEQ